MMILTFTGIQRCGNHAIIDWVARHFSHCIHHNNMDPITRLAAQIVWYGKHDEPIKNIIMSYENFSISSIKDPINGIILRDPYNWYASLMRRWYLLHPPALQTPEKIIGRYIEYCDYAMEYPLSRFINYNIWFTSTEYRRELESRYSLPIETDLGIDTVPTIGRGSSFDGMSMQGRAQEMGVLTRYKSELDNPVYQRLILSNPRLREISYSLFDFIPEEIE
jgi:hypothetical protein